MTRRGRAWLMFGRARLRLGSSAPASGRFVRPGSEHQKLKPMVPRGLAHRGGGSQGGPSWIITRRQYCVEVFVLRSWANRARSGIPPLPYVTAVLVHAGDSCSVVPDRGFLPLWEYLATKIGAALRSAGLPVSAEGEMRVMYRTRPGYLSRVLRSLPGGGTVPGDLQVQKQPSPPGVEHVALDS